MGKSAVLYSSSGVRALAAVRGIRAHADAARVLPAPWPMAAAWVVCVLTGRQLIKALAREAAMSPPVPPRLSNRTELRGRDASHASKTCAKWLQLG